MVNPCVGPTYANVWEKLGAIPWGSALTADKANRRSYMRSIELAVVPVPDGFGDVAKRSVHFTAVLIRRRTFFGPRLED